MPETIDQFEKNHLLNVYYDYVYDEDEYAIDNDYFETSEFSERIHISEITKACVLPTLRDVCSSYFPVLFLCLLFQFSNKYIPVSSTMKHTSSGILGLIVLYSYFQNLISHFLILSFITYLVLMFASNIKCLTTVVSFALLSYLTLREFTFEGSSWPRIRNLQMLIVMKIISLVSDLENRRISRLPSLSHYFGYMFCVGNCIFGPWVSYSVYLDMFGTKPLTLIYVLRIMKCVFCSLLFFALSMCYLDWILQDSNYANLILMYTKALEFRSSHYFIMFMSESFALASGSFSSDFKESGALTMPSRIEFPRSLVEVVIYWNIPMHKWLKTYVFKPLSKYGHFAAILCTYFVSSLLHGLNYQLSGILLSLSIYTFVEHVFRQKLACRFNACILSKSCPSECSKHKHKERSMTVRLVNLLFTFIALYHLSYLGYLIDLRNDQKLTLAQSFHRWHVQWYSSHIMAVVTLMVCWLL